MEGVGGRGSNGAGIVEERVGRRRRGTAVTETRGSGALDVREKKEWRDDCRRNVAGRPVLMGAGVSWHSRANGFVLVEGLFLDQVFSNLV